MRRLAVAERDAVLGRVRAVAGRAALLWLALLPVTALVAMAALMFCGPAAAAGKEMLISYCFVAGQ